MDTLVNEARPRVFSAEHFAAVEQRFRLLGETPAPAQFIVALREELAFKQESGMQRMGF